VERFARHVTVLQDTCPGLVSQIESGLLDAPETRLILLQALLPMLEQDVDTVVMGCTHYPFVIPMIQEIVGPNIEVIDPAPAVARQAGRVLETRGLLAASGAAAETQFLTTGDPARFAEMAHQLLGQESFVQHVQWESGILH
ncbi:MAG TPA: aspartate/glutamate racemase family protein, partial [Anaerolineaceae bacterium]